MQQDFPNGSVQHFLVLEKEFSSRLKDRGRISYAFHCLVIGIRSTETQTVRRPKSVVGPFAGYAPLQKMGLSQKWHRRQTPPRRGGGRKEGRKEGRTGRGREADDKTGKYRCVHRIVGLMSRAHPPLPVAAASSTRAALVCHF